MSRHKQLVRVIDSPDTDRIVVDGLTTVKMHIIPFARIYGSPALSFYGYDRSFKFYKLHNSKADVDIWLPVEGDSIKYYNSVLRVDSLIKRHKESVALRVIEDFNPPDDCLPIPKHII